MRENVSIPIMRAINWNSSILLKTFFFRKKITATYTSHITTFFLFAREKHKMPAYNSPQINKTNARRALERVAEMRNGTVDVHNSVAGFCNNPGSENYGKVWALLSTDNGVVQYSGFADDNLRRSTVKMASNDFDSKRAAMAESKMSDGFKDISSDNMPLFPLDANATYRGTTKSPKKMCNLFKSGKKKTKKSCKKSSTCSWVKGKKTKSGKIKRKGYCKKSTKKKSTKKKATKKIAKKKTTKTKSPKRIGMKKSSKPSKCNTLKSGNKKKMKACKKSSKCSWIKGKKGSHKGYCKKKA